MLFQHWTLGVLVGIDYSRYGCLSVAVRDFLEGSRGFAGCGLKN